MKSVETGDQAPDFTLPSQTGEDVTLSGLRGESTVVLYFYPKDETPGCTREACSFRDSYEDFVDAGAVVVGVSADTVSSHESFADGHELPFTLLADESNQVRKLYGVPKTLGLLPGRVTYVIDKQGYVRHVFNSQLFFDRHVSEALATVKQLALET